MNKNKLSEDQYYITHQHGTEPPFQVNIYIIKKKVFINVFVVILICSQAIPSMNHIVDGLPSLI